MCGIAGALSVDRDRAERACRAALAALHHRGPDDHGLVTVRLGDRWLSVAHARLAIIDLSESGRQPMLRGPLPPGGRGSSAPGGDGQGLVFNGEIYNYASLREVLSVVEPPQAFGSRSDTEVLLHGLAREGASFVPRLRGMFAFAAWDPRAGRLLLGRDRFGIKPLYYRAAGEDFLFASEVRALLATGLVPRSIDREGVFQYLAYGAVQDPHTVVEGVRALPPAHTLEVVDGRPSAPRRYWSLPTQVDTTITPTDAVGEVRRLLRDAVGLHLVSDVPVGAFLSGGVDSSSLVALMAHQSSEPVRTLTVESVEGRGDSRSEKSFAELVARRWNTRHEVAVVSAADVEERLRQAVAAQDQPSIDGMNSFIVSQSTRAAGCTVAVSGLGADELFLGYGSFKRLPMLRALSRLGSLGPVAKVAAQLLPFDAVVGRKLSHIIGSGGDLMQLSRLQRMLFFTYQRHELLRPGWRLPLDADTGPVLDPEETPTDPYNFLSAFELRGYVQNMLLRDTDAMSMAHGLEVRVPFLDHVLVELVLSLPGSFKVRRGEQKPLLVGAMKPLLPPETYKRRKVGFNLAIPEWMKTSLRAGVEDVLLAPNELLDPDVTAKLWKAFLRGDDPRLWSRLWGLYTLVSWLRRHVWNDGAGRLPLAA